MKRLALALVACGCLPATPRFAVKGVDTLEVLRVANDSAFVRLSLRVVSESSVAAVVRPLSYEVGLADRPTIVANGSSIEPILVEPGRSTALTLPFEVRLGDLPSDLPRWIERGGVPFRARALLRAKTLAGEFDVVAESSGSAALGAGFELLINAAFTEQGLQIARILPPTWSLHHLTFRFEVVFRSLLPFAIHVRSLTYRIKVGGAFLGESKVSRGFAVEPGPENREILPLEVPFWRLGESMRAALRALSSREVEVEGEAEIAPIGPVERVPFRVVTRF